MSKISRTELNQQTARALARVAAGERLVITDRGRPVAELTPPSRSRWDELVDAGIVAPARPHGPLSFESVESSETVAEMLDDLRADRP